jgi:hypothetical protein
MLRIISLTLMLIWLPDLCQGQQQQHATDLLSRLRAVKGIYVKKIDPLPGFKEGYEIALVQPVDHKNPTGLKFTQRIFLSHRDFSKPVVLETEGYGAPWPKERELAKILDANQIIVEHRYYESSKPNLLNWEYLTSWQAASDHHRIVEILKKIYPGKWVSSGRSKGGMAALFHRAYFPDDVDATVTYVAPVMLGPADPRFDAFLDSAVDTLFRSQVKGFQKTCLGKRSGILPLLKKQVEKQNLVFPCSLDEVLERVVLEFPYTFCFGSHQADEIPASDAPPGKIVDFLTNTVSLSHFSTTQLRYNAGLYYQQFTELGYFSYAAPHIRQMVQFAKDPFFTFFVPKDALNAKFKRDAMLKVLDYLQNKGNNIIYLYGEFDIYTACAVELTGKTNAIKIIAKGYGHQFNISDLPASDKKQVISTLESWLIIKVDKEQ